MKYIRFLLQQVVLKRIMLASMVFLIVFGCSGSGQEKLYKGWFIDGQVQGVEYFSGTRRGLTDSEGAFYYAQGDTVTFYLGDVLIGGPVPGKSLISPLDFVSSDSAFSTNSKVINICRLLQSLDVDGNLSNGIYISAEIREHLYGVNLDFSLSPEDFEDSPAIVDLFNKLNYSVVFTDPGPRRLRSSAEAMAHFREVMAKFGLGRFVLIGLGDGFTAGSQSGLHNLNEYTQKYGFMQSLANHLNLSSNLLWNPPLLSLADDGSSVRKEPESIPFNLAVPGAAINNIVSEKTGEGNTLLDKVLTPIPAYTGVPVTQLEAAEYVADLYPDRKKILIMTAGFYDVLYPAVQDKGSRLTVHDIQSFFADTSAGHDLESMRANLDFMVNRLSNIPHSFLFMANLPYIESLGALFYKTDLEFIAGFDQPQVYALNADQAIGWKAFFSLIGSEFNHALSVMSNNSLLNEAISAIAADENVLSPEEAALINERVDAFNYLLKSLADSYYNVFLIDINALFQSLYNREIIIEKTDLSGVVTSYQLSRNFGGGFFSLDGVHPSHTGYGLIADKFIAGINQALAIVNIPSVNIADIWNSDPYWDKDGDSFIPGSSVAGVIDPLYIPLLDCDDSDPLILSPHVQGIECN